MLIKRLRNQWLRAFEAHYLEALLQHHGGNVTVAARAAGLDRAYLYRLKIRCGRKR